MQAHQWRHPGHKVTTEHKHNIMVAFQNADEGRKGFLTPEDLKVAFVSLFGYKPSKHEMEDLMSREDKGKSPVMTLGTFMDIASGKIEAQDFDDEIRQIFLAFDVACRGFITLDNAKKIFEQIAPFLDSKSVEKVFREIDSDHDGRISYRDFEFMMKYSVG